MRSAGAPDRSDTLLTAQSVPYAMTLRAPLPAAVPAALRQRRKEARPGELLDAALDLFVEKGFAATRSEEVASRAGVSKGTLYLYYPSKEELLKEVIRHNVVNQIAEGMEIVRAFEGSSSELITPAQAQRIDTYFMSELKRLASDFPYEEFCRLAPGVAPSAPPQPVMVKA